LNTSKQIQRLTAVLLLLILVLSTIPKPFIHSLFADHKDVDNSCLHRSHDAPCVKTDSVNCHFDDLVVNLPYVEQVDGKTEPTEVVFSCFLSPEVSFQLATTWLSKDNRGPPVS
jgi:hypothetical protein